jgi:hypothetical protein
MARVLAGAVGLAVLATPAFAAGDAFEGSPWIGAIFSGSVLALFGFLAAGTGFFLQGFMRLRNALFFVIFVLVVFLTLLVNGFGLEKTVRIIPLLALMLAVCSPPFGLGWFIGTRDAKRRIERSPAIRN